MRDPVKLSNELQIGKAAEHLVCSDLILKGYNAFLSDQGIPYDILVEAQNKFLRVQVKSTLKPVVVKTYNPKSTSDNRPPCYRFCTRRAKKTARPVEMNEIDYYAFVALDIKEIAYLPIESMVGRIEGKAIQCIEFLPPRNPDDEITPRGRNRRYINEFRELNL